MCMLFAVNSREEFYANDYLKKFYKNSDKHPHGWGLASGDKHGFTVEKESLCALESHYLKERLGEAVSAKTVLAHIRYATIGNVAYKNCHPFTAKDNRTRRWVMIHNGTIFDYPPLNSYTAKQSGDTDSERIFLYLMDRLNEAPDNFEERFKLLDSIIPEMAQGNKLNLILTDGKYLYVHTNCRDTLFSLKKNGAVLFATAPLTDENWKPVEFCTLLAFHKGKLAATGTAHNGEYIESEENMKLLYQIFSAL